MSGDRWSVTVVVTVHGVWNLADEQACADLIATVNELRDPDNKRPCIRRGWWSNDKDPWLDVKIGRTSMRINGGEHLVSVLMPNGSVNLLALDACDLDMLRPPKRQGAAALDGHRR